MTARPFAPRQYQAAMLRHLVAHDRCQLLAEMGTGKTSGTLHALQACAMFEDPFPALVLGPKRVADITWPDEVQKWDDFRHLRVASGCGGIANVEKALAQRPDILTLNYDNLPALLQVLEVQGKRVPFRTVIADEAAKLRNFRLRGGGIRAKALAKFAHLVKRWVNLSGLYLPNSVLDAWGPMWFVDAGERLERTYTLFARKYGELDHDGVLRAAPWAFDKIMERIADVSLSIRAADWFDLPPLVHSVVPVDIGRKATALYRDMERKLFMELNGREIEAFNAGVKTMKLLQIANGAVYHGEEDAGGWTELHQAKLDALDDILADASGPVIVAYHFKADLARLRARFPQGRELDADPQTVRDWNAGRIPVLFAHPASAGHGLNLQDGGNVLVFFGHWWSLENRAQIIERIGPTRQAQSGHNRPCYVHDIVARGTVDELVLLRQESKREVNDLLMERLKERYS